MEIPTARRWAVCILGALASPAQAQSVTFQALLETSGPIAHGQTVRGSIWVNWTPGSSAAIGYGLGAFRLRMDGLTPADLDLPDEGPPGTLPWDHGGRRPRSSVADVLGGFRFPPVSDFSPVGVHYATTVHDGAAYLTSITSAGENRIRHSQIAPVFGNTGFVTDTMFKLFRFSVRAPLSGAGTVTITPEGLGTELFLDEDGDRLAVPNQAAPASFSFAPAPASVLLLVLAVPRRRCRDARRPCVPERRRWLQAVTPAPRRWRYE
jgi:hypothetical protein